MAHHSPAHLQVMWNRLLAVVEEQGQILIRAAFSPIVRECGDISAGIFDVQGRMLATTAGPMVRLGPKWPSMMSTCI